jgi:hypothetical protein
MGWAVHVGLNNRSWISWWSLGKEEAVCHARRAVASRGPLACPAIG